METNNIRYVNVYEVSPALPVNVLKCIKKAEITDREINTTSNIRKNKNRVLIFFLKKLNTNIFDYSF